MLQKNIAKSQEPVIKIVEDMPIDDSLTDFEPHTLNGVFSKSCFSNWRRRQCNQFSPSSFYIKIHKKLL